VDHTLVSQHGKHPSGERYVKHDEDLFFHPQENHVIPRIQINANVNNRSNGSASLVENRLTNVFTNDGLAGSPEATAVPPTAPLLIVCEVNESEAFAAKRQAEEVECAEVRWMMNQHSNEKTPLAHQEGIISCHVKNTIDLLLRSCRTTETIRVHKKVDGFRFRPFYLFVALFHCVLNLSLELFPWILT
jgi:hypothetical protein